MLYTLLREILRLRIFPTVLNLATFWVFKRSYSFETHKCLCQSVKEMCAILVKGIAKYVDFGIRGEKYVHLRECTTSTSTYAKLFETA